MLYYDALIFDIDGTLWNALSATAKGWTQGLKDIGEKKNISKHDVQQVAGYSIEQCFDILFPGMQKKHPHLVQQLDSAETQALKQFGGTFYPGVHEGIQKLSEHYKIFLISNCQDWYLKLFLHFSELKKCITDYDCNGMSGKNKSDMLKTMQEKHSLKHPVYIGDISNDEVQAKKAGIEFMHAAYGFGAAIAPRETFHSFPEITNYFLQFVD